MKFSKIELQLIKNLVAAGKSQEDAEKEVIAMRESTEEEVVMSAEAIESIAKAVTDQVKPMVATQVADSMKEFAEKNETIINKGIGGGTKKEKGQGGDEVEALDAPLR